MANWFSLEGPRVKLEPLEREHHAILSEIGTEPEIWRWIPTPRTTPEAMGEYIEEALAWRDAGTAFPFVTREKTTNEIVGSTRYAQIDKTNRRLEIGWTWIVPRWQRSHVNTEAKFLMLQHAFEVMGCRRVELKTDALNEKSRNAILRIGAKEEGTLRSHVLTHTGRWRDTVYFSILSEEWPMVKDRLLERLQ